MDSKTVNSSQLTVHSKTQTVNREPTTVNQNGFSLIELVTGFAIIGLVSILIGTLYFANFRLFSNQNTLIEVSSQNKTALAEMINQIRESQSVTSTCTACAGDTTSPTVLVLRLWPINASGEPFDPGASAYDYIVYKRDETDNTKLIKKTLPDATSARASQTKIISTNVASLQFSYDNADPDLVTEVTVELTNSQTINGKTQTSSQSAKAILRNK